ncbi:DMT family transporter [Enterobacter asburiae]|uniref:DMT family transporter n=1 Tax=Enterobacter asburiae TaxID=61645 RepID=UPI002148ECA1|nr:DMT family transporter [Enterobacter asburiae]UUR73850.1 DMT family transporter [Enterobacter asburiae]
MHKNMVAILLFIVVSLTWGTTWLAMQIAVKSISPVLATGLRFLCAAPVLLCIAGITKMPLLFPPGERVFQCMVVLFYFSLPFTLMIYGEQFVSSALAAIIFATMPAAVLVASVILLRQRTNLLQLTGLLMALLSLCGILLFESNGDVEGHTEGVIALMLAVVMHAIIYTQCKKRCSTLSVITFNALPCLFAGLLLSVAGIMLENDSIDGFSPASLGAVMYLGIVAGVCGILSYFALQKKAGVFQASLVFLVFPIIAICLESGINGYMISLHSIYLFFPLGIGLLLVLLFPATIPYKTPKK